MPTIQIWVTDYDFEDLRRLKKYLEHKVEEEFEGKAWRWDYGRRGKRKRVRPPKINDSYVYKKALNYYWLLNEKRVIAFEKSKKHR